jgi:2-hydroxy-4-carboxymuconate semialdehyde hemiacetal dehydrogenase
MRVAIVGYGAVAAIHARQIAGSGQGDVVAVCGPDAAKGQTFAREHRITRVLNSPHELVGAADAAVICSPSPLHFEHACSVLEAGLAALVEVPACGTREEALELATLAERRGLKLRGAHTSSYLTAYRRLGELMGRGELGDVRQIHVVRTIAPRTRSWTDDALLHHAAHPLHLLLRWFPSIRWRGCAAHPAAIGAQHVAVLGALENGAPVSVSVSYEARVPAGDFLVVGERHSFSTDGFSRITCDIEGQAWTGDAEAEYHGAVRAQDLDFLAACRGGDAGVPWEETIALAGAIDELRRMGDGKGASTKSGSSEYLSAAES